jgi:hypothetical protein
MMNPETQAFTMKDRERLPSGDTRVGSTCHVQQTMDNSNHKTTERQEQQRSKAQGQRKTKSLTSFRVLGGPTKNEKIFLLCCKM